MVRSLDETRDTRHAVRPRRHGPLHTRDAGGNRTLVCKGPKGKSLAADVQLKVNVKILSDYNNCKP